MTKRIGFPHDNAVSQDGLRSASIHGETVPPKIMNAGAEHGSKRHLRKRTNKMKLFVDLWNSRHNQTIYSPAGIVDERIRQDVKALVEMSPDEALESMLDSDDFEDQLQRLKAFFDD